MPADVESPSVALSFANNFWGKDDAGVSPLLERMAAAKTTCDELRSFYSARASIEEDYARKLMSLCRKSLGSQEMGSLKTSLDTVRGELESMARQHASNAVQMKTELEEPLGAFTGGMKERRKIVQNTVEKLLKVKVQQTATVNKTRDRYEQECLKIKGYLAQGHMVMGQEERKNKAKLEKTQISVATTNTEYEHAIKALEDTTGRWNREWKAAADKFQDLEEERLDFTKASLWTFANIASTVCVSDDASCEKIRLSLEDLDVEKDITHFITERGTGQEIPDAPKYINFCRGDVDDHPPEAPIDDDNYSVAQFPRSINPAYRSSSPQPSTFESHHDPNSQLARELSGQDTAAPPGLSPEEVLENAMRSHDRHQPPQQRSYQAPPTYQSYQAPQDRRIANAPSQDASQFASVPHDPYPMDGMTMLCRTDGMNGMNGMNSATSSNLSSNRPSSRDDNSDYSNPTSFSSQEPVSGHVSPVKQEPPVIAEQPEKRALKKKSGFFQNHSPFRRKSTKEAQAANRNTWGPSSANSTPRRPQVYQPEPSQNRLADRAPSPDPIDANATLALNVGQNVFPVSNSDRQAKPAADTQPDSKADQDPIALALAELKVSSGTQKQSTDRVSADRYAGIATPAPEKTQAFARSMPPRANTDISAAQRGTPPQYDNQVQRLGVPPPAVTSKAMQAASRKYAEQTSNMFNSSRPRSEAYTAAPTRPTTRGADVPRATSPAPLRSVSPRPAPRQDPRPAPRQEPARQDPRPAPRQQPPRQDPRPAPRQEPRQDPRQDSRQTFRQEPRQDPRPDTRQSHRAVSPNPYGSASSQFRNSASSLAGSASKRDSAQTYSRFNSPSDYRHASPNEAARSASPAPSYRGDYTRPLSRAAGSDISAGVGPDGSEYGGSMRGRGGGRPGTSSSARGGGQLSFWDGRDPMAEGSRQRSKSVADPSRQYTPDGRPILHYARALYMYQAAIPEELGFNKGDTLAVLRHQDDGWWEAEIHAGNGVGMSGLVPSNYLQPC